jgi:hypothetical protein
MNLRKEREAFLMSMGVKIESFRRETLKFNGGGGGGGSVNGGGGRSGGAVCRECLMARMKGTSVDFHLCCYDEVIVGFRTSAGPISRPVRNSGEDGH